MVDLFFAFSPSKIVGGGASCEELCFAHVSPELGLEHCDSTLKRIIHINIIIMMKLSYSNVSTYS